MCAKKTPSTLTPDADVRRFRCNQIRDQIIIRDLSLQNINSAIKSIFSDQENGNRFASGGWRMTQAKTAKKALIYNDKLFLKKYPPG